MAPGAGYPKAPYYDDVRWPGADGLRVPQEAAPASLYAYKELSLTQASGTVTLNSIQAGASSIVVTPTADMTIVLPGCQPGRMITIVNLAAFTVTVEIAGNTTNTAVVPASTIQSVIQTGYNLGVALVN